MYEVRILPSAHRELVQIAGYIRNKLKNPIAADRFLASVEKAFELLAEFPYANPVFQVVRETGDEVRSLMVDNYLLSYNIREDAKKVEVIAVVYAKRDLRGLPGIKS